MPTIDTHLGIKFVVDEDDSNKTMSFVPIFEKMLSSLYKDELKLITAFIIDHYNFTLTSEADKLEEKTVLKAEIAAELRAVYRKMLILKTIH